MPYIKKNMASLIVTALLTTFIVSSCQKLMQENPSSDMNTPDTFEEMEAIFNDRNTMNVTPGLNDLSGDNYYLLNEFWQQLNTIQQNAYIWKPDIYGKDTATTDYDLCSALIRNANLVLEGLNKIGVTDDPLLWNKYKGQALFFRSCGFYYMAQLYAKVYDQASAATDLGVPLRLSSSLNEKSIRTTVLQTYRRIIQDLKLSIPLLNQLDVANKRRPSKAAAYAMLARTYQSMAIHDTAGLYADSCLLLYNRLVDYNSIDLSKNKPFSQDNPEIIFETSASDKIDALLATFAWGCIVDSTLYKMYNANDLRIEAFYTSADSVFINYKKSYAGSAFAFTGIAVDELYLIRAESRTRAGNITEGMNDLNMLLKNRWKQGAFVPETASTVHDALEIILRERRKELPLRGVRWTDLRRLNREGFGIMPRRYLNGTLYTLVPNDRLYVLPFPEDVIQLTNMQQNPR